VKVAGLGLETVASLRSVGEAGWSLMNWMRSMCLVPVVMVTSPRREPSAGLGIMDSGRNCLTHIIGIYTSGVRVVRACVPGWRSE
jgi:hypothetical protein